MINIIARLMRMFPVLVMVLVFSMLFIGCGKDCPTCPETSELNTSPHLVSSGFWGDGEIEADDTWRFISYSESESGIIVIVSWNITLRNMSSSKYRVLIKRFTFEDKDGFQIFESYNERGFVNITLDADESRNLQGNLNLDLQSLEVANSITKMGIWASISII